MRDSFAGLLLLNASLQPLYANSEALQILSYPETAEPLAPLDGLLFQRIWSLLLAAENGAGPVFVREFLSGRRRYLCRIFSLDGRSNGVMNHPAVAVILERTGRKSFDASMVAACYQLTPREQETLQYLKQGLTNKEIGRLMKISPNTVKAFLKVIMTKMGVSTRAGIIGKAIDQGCYHPASGSQPFDKLGSGLLHSASSRQLG